MLQSAARPRLLTDDCLILSQKQHKRTLEMFFCIKTQKEAVRRSSGGHAGLCTAH